MNVNDDDTTNVYEVHGFPSLLQDIITNTWDTRPVFSPQVEKSNNNLQNIRNRNGDNKNNDSIPTSFHVAYDPQKKDDPNGVHKTQFHHRPKSIGHTTCENHIRQQ